MKTKLLLKKQQANAFYILLVFCLCFNYGWSQTNLVKNGTADDHGTGSDTSNTSDNADAFDMTPNSTLNGGIVSPYRYDADTNPNGWYNSELADWLATNCGDSDEQPGSSSDGNYDYSAGADMGVKTRGVKISEACRRLYQKVAVTPGKTYTFSIESRSEKQFDNGGSLENVNSGVFMLNQDIVTEVGLGDGAADSRVDAFLEITNDFNASKSNATTDNFTKSTLTFTASSSFVIIYVRAPQAIDDSHEVFYDNISLVEEGTASTKDILASRFKVYPNPANDIITIASNNIDITSISVYSVLGKQVLAGLELENDRLNISELAKGVYFLKINSDQGAVTKKIIKE
ncbi:T9SS type A sorting domain-containing protein [Algibacter mikhailovii]|uniref:T9SS type A sorting domain-containing protein n=1 Tax=Algibacter mikhailovii TaxID=425498 RepID=UPI002493F74D|nr:T9SS type A sorting domain-containing protein [Algibacter mikhailovii]